MANFKVIDKKLSTIMNLREKWLAGNKIDNTVKQKIKDEIQTFPAALEVHEKLLKTLENELETVDQDPREWACTVGRNRMLPVRNNVKDIPGYVKGFTDYNGLVHGGTVQAPNFSITVRAYRLTWMRRYHGSSGHKRDEHREAVVAGIVEKRYGMGFVEKFSTASYLPLKYVSKSYYNSISAALPTPGINCVYWKKKKRRWTMDWVGFYFPNGWNNHAGHAADNGQPSYAHWGSLGGAYFWDYTPSHATGVESPFYNPYISSSPGFVISTPYVKVFHLTPESNEMIVFLIGAARNQSQRKTCVNFFNRLPAWPETGWYTRTFIEKRPRPLWDRWKSSKT